MTTLRGLIFLMAVSTAGFSHRLASAQQWALRPSIDGSGTSVRLEPHDGKIQFRLGDPITLDLVLTGESGGYTTFRENNNFDFPQVNVIPADGWFQTQGQSLESPETSGQYPVRIPLVLNRSIVFQQPGYYRITITTTHLQASATGVLAPAPGSCCRETTNAVGIDILPRDDHEESELVTKLSSLLEKKPDAFPSDDFKKRQKLSLDELDNVSKNPQTADPQRIMKLLNTLQSAQEKELAHIKEQKKLRRQTAIRLSYLQGDDAVRAKVRWILADKEDGEDGTGLAMLDGLAHSRNLQLQLQLFQAAWSDTERVPTGLLQSALQQTKAFLKHETFELYYSHGVPGRTQPNAEVVAEYQREMNELLPSLSQRSSPTREQTMAFLISKVNPTDGLRLRAEIEKVFGGMSPEIQNSLLRTNWPGLCDREFPIPSEPLKSSCGMTGTTGVPPPPDDNPDANQH